jgi:hypothetical protein
MRVGRIIAIASGLLLLAGCGESTPAEQANSAVIGQVHLGPQCPVQHVADPCEDEPAVHATVTVAEPVPGDPTATGKLVAQTTTDPDGHFRIAVPPGQYVVTADAGMSCDRPAAHVTAGADSKVDIACDTGIR